MPKVRSIISGGVEGDMVYVSRVVDGDTVVVKMISDTSSLIPKDATIRVRLDGIDAPEKRQPFGAEATAKLKELVYTMSGPDTRGTPSLPEGGYARLWLYDVDRYGRGVGMLWTHPHGDLNAEMVRTGYAWVYDRYSSVPNLYYAWEEEAKEQKRGLWAQEKPQPPWEWRKAHRYNRGIGCDKCGSAIARWQTRHDLAQYCSHKCMA